MIALNDWSARRRAMIELYDNPNMPLGWKPRLDARASRLAILCEENGHPICAMAIRMRMNGAKLKFEDLMAEVEREQRDNKRT